MLEDDALRFDAFLKENDERVQDAIHKAENEAKNKQEKVISTCCFSPALKLCRNFCSYLTGMSSLPGQRSSALDMTW